MKRYITGYNRLIGVWSIVLAASLCMLFSCTDESEGTIFDGHNVSMEVSTRAGGTAAELVRDMRLFTFIDGTPNEQKFRQEVRNIKRTGTQLTAQIETGTWNLAMVAAPSGSIVVPTIAAPMSTLPMYVYAPTEVGGKSTDAAEIFLDNKKTPLITSGGNHTMSAQLNRTVAKVQLIINKTTPNFDLGSTHTIELNNIPSTISYTGALLPTKNAPTLLASPLKAGVTLRNAGSGVYEGTDTITFIIPAHQGSDFLNSNPVDTIQTKMNVSVKFKRTGGNYFEESAEIPFVAKCNKILQVRIDINDGLEFKTEVLPWERVDMGSTVGQEYANWLYVKKGAQGNGISWSDPLPDINTAISKAAVLKNAGKTVHGILVAGGESLVYGETLDLPEGIKIYGGWKGTAGTELLLNDAVEPHTSTHRDLKNYKVRLATNESVILSKANTALDGFIVTGAGRGDKPGLVVVSNNTAWINAIEIDSQNGIVSTHALSISNGLATNVLVSRNNKGVSLTGAGQLVNATIANNTAASEFSGTLYNTVYWGNTPVAPGTVLGIIQYCAFEGTNESIPSGTNQSNNYPLSNSNDAWFTTSNVIPGPHFNQSANASKPYYTAGTPKPNRAPQLGRGNQAAFDNVTTIVPTSAKKDINGNPRHNLGTDIGCYEDADSEGFRLRWYSDRVYVSSKGGYSSELPLMLPDNEEQEIGVSWNVTVIGTLNHTTFLGPNSGSGTGTIVGTVNLKNAGETPTNDYTENAERYCGKIRVSTNLKSYLPDADIDIYQTPGKSAVWETGYVGSFHRNNEMGARYITGPNSGAWSARIINGMDWIAIDGHDKNYGEDIIGEQNVISGGYMKKVEETFGGVVEGTGQIKFRVGMKSKNITGKPRYGLIVITRSTGVAMFFVRQGEDADYLYRPEDPRTGGRADAKKFSTYNLTDPQSRNNNGGNELGAKNATWTSHPSKVGYYFQWNRSTAYLRGKQTTALPSTKENSYSLSRDACPNGYRLGTYSEWVMSVYQNVPMPARTDKVSPSGPEVLRNFVYGRYADGYYDQLAPDPVTSTTDVVGAISEPGKLKETGIARKGILMINHYNYATIFFPTTGIMSATSPTTESNNAHAMYHTSTTAVEGSSTKIHNTHWTGGSSPHVGMSCTQIHGSSGTAGNGSWGNTTIPNAAPVRCIKE